MKKTAQRSNFFNQRGWIHLTIPLVIILLITGFFVFKAGYVDDLLRIFHDGKVSATNTPIIGSPVKVDQIPDSSSDYVYTYVAKTDNNGHVYIYWTEDAVYPNDDRALFRVSTDYGKTFTFGPIAIPTPPNTNILSAASVLSPGMCNDNKGHVYLLREYTSKNISDSVRVYINVSTDNGQTWLPNDIQLSQSFTGGAGHTTFPRISCDENGHVYVVWSDERNGIYNVFFNTSSDYGQTWLAQESRTDPGLDIETRIINGQITSNHQFALPKISADNSGHVYITWQHAKFVAGDVLKNDIYTAYSSDFGNTFSQPIRVDHALDTTQVTSPAIYADQTGHVYISWLERLASETNFNVFLNKSQDFGVTWQMSDQKINSQSASLQNLAGQGVLLSGDNSGGVYGLWREYLSGIGEKPFVNYSQDFGTNWHNDTNLDTHTEVNSGAGGSSLSADKLGKVYSTFVINRDIWFNYSDNKGEGWLASPVQLDSSFESVEGTELPEYGYPYQSGSYLAHDDNGNVYVLFGDHHYLSFGNLRTNLYLVPITFSSGSPAPNITPNPTPIGTGTSSPGPSPTLTPSPSPTPTPQSTQKKRVFVTSSAYTGKLGGLSGADSKCQNKAKVAKLGGSWKAWLSDSKTSTSSRLNHHNGPYVRIDGKMVANDWADLTDGTLQNPIRIDESGKDAYITVSNGAWTGTTISGSTSTPNCSDWSNGISRLQGIFGGISATNSYWTVGSTPTSDCSNKFVLYCFEQ